MGFRWKPNKEQASKYANACREAEQKGFKISKSVNGLSIYGEVNGKFTRISNHDLPDYYPKNFDKEILCRSQKEVFKEIGIDL